MSACVGYAKLVMREWCVRVTFELMLIQIVILPTSKRCWNVTFSKTFKIVNSELK